MIKINITILYIIILVCMWGKGGCTSIFVSLIRLSEIMFMHDIIMYIYIIYIYRVNCRDLTQVNLRDFSVRLSDLLDVHPVYIHIIICNVFAKGNGLERVPCDR